MELREHHGRRPRSGQQRRLQQRNGPTHRRRYLHHRRPRRRIRQRTALRRGRVQLHENQPVRQHRSRQRVIRDVVPVRYDARPDRRQACGAVAAGWRRPLPAYAAPVQPVPHVCQRDRRSQQQYGGTRRMAAYRRFLRPDEPQGQVLCQRRARQRKEHGNLGRQRRHRAAGRLAQEHRHHGPAFDEGRRGRHPRI